VGTGSRESLDGATSREREELRGRPEPGDCAPVPFFSFSRDRDDDLASPKDEGPYVHTTKRSWWHL
jgi:hypothetical protein